MYLKAKFIILCMLSLLSLGILAEEIVVDGPPAPLGFSIGTDHGSVAGNFITGIRVGSPSFFNGWARVILSGHLGWLQDVITAPDFSRQWLPYGLYKAGINIGNFMPNLPVRIAGTLEFALVTPSSKISSRSLGPGLSGGLDTELFLDSARHHTFFWAFGGIGLFNATADQLLGKPTYATGYNISTGYRFYF